MNKRIIIPLCIMVAISTLILTGCGLQSISSEAKEGSSAETKVASSGEGPCLETGGDLAPRYRVGKKWPEAPSDYTFCLKKGADSIPVYYLAYNEEYPKETVQFFLQRKEEGKWINVADFTSTKEGLDENVHIFKKEYDQPLQEGAEYRLYYVDKGTSDYAGTIVMSFVEYREGNEER